MYRAKSCNVFITLVIPPRFFDRDKNLEDLFQFCQIRKLDYLDHEINFFRCHEIESVLEKKYLKIKILKWNNNSD